MGTFFPSWILTIHQTVLATVLVSKEKKNLFQLMQMRKNCAGLLTEITQSSSNNHWHYYTDSPYFIGRWWYYLSRMIHWPSISGKSPGIPRIAEQSVWIDLNERPCWHARPFFASSSSSISFRLSLRGNSRTILTAFPFKHSALVFFMHLLLQQINEKRSTAIKKMK